MEKAKQEQERRNQERRLEEERREKEQREKELKEKLEREEHDKRKKEEEEKGHQEKKKLERQKAEEEEDKENQVWEEKERRGKEQNSDTPSKSMSLDSPAPNHIVSEIKVSPLFTANLRLNLLLLSYILHSEPTNPRPQHTAHQSASDELEDFKGLFGCCEAKLH